MRGVWMGRIFPSLLILAAIGFGAETVGVGAAQEAASKKTLLQEVRHQILLLPYYSVFDNISYSVKHDVVTLQGQVVRPTLKSDAAAAVSGPIPPSTSISKERARVSRSSAKCRIFGSISGIKT